MSAFDEPIEHMNPSIFARLLPPDNFLFGSRRHLWLIQFTASLLKILNEQLKWWHSFYCCDCAEPNILGIFLFAKYNAKKSKNIENVNMWNVLEMLCCCCCWCCEKLLNVFSVRCEFDWPSLLIRFDVNLQDYFSFEVFW